MGKKGGAKNKLARMSEEERARYLQHRADIEEEAKRRKQQLIAMYMKNKLKREDAFSRLNLAKINQEWRFILRQVKCQEMRGEIKAMEDHFTDCIERKNRVIRRLLCDLDESEEIYSTMLHTHMENIEKINSIYNDRLRYFREAYEKNRKILLDRNEKEVTRYLEYKEKAQRELEAVFYGLEENAEKSQSEAHERHLQKLDEFKNAINVNLENLTREREQDMDNLWKEFQSVLNGYLKHKEQYRNEYIDLRRRDSEETHNIKNHYIDVARMTELISELKSHLEVTRDDHQVDILQLQNSKKALQLQYDNIKKKFEKNMTKDRENLKIMVLSSEDATKELNTILKKGEGIINLVTMCRKLETEEEKVLPFGPRKKIMFQFTEMEMKSAPEIFERSKNHLLHNFEKFWIRYNTAKIDVSSLEEERAKLKDENKKLKEKLKDYLTNMTVATGAGVEVTDGRFVQRPSSMKIEKVIHIDLTKSTEVKHIKRRPVTCIEGNLSVAIRSQKLVQNKGRFPAFIQNQ